MILWLIGVNYWDFMSISIHVGFMSSIQGSSERFNRFSE